MTALTVSLANGNVQTFNLLAAGDTYTVTLPSSGMLSGKSYSFVLRLKQGATTVSTLTWPASGLKWPGGTAPELTATVGAEDIFTFVTFDQGTTWYGFVSGQDFQVPA